MDGARSTRDGERLQFQHAAIWGGDHSSFLRWGWGVMYVWVCGVSVCGGIFVVNLYVVGYGSFSGYLLSRQDRLLLPSPSHQPSSSIDRRFMALLHQTWPTRI
jgi:hypothetical protein